MEKMACFDNSPFILPHTKSALNHTSKRWVRMIKFFMSSSRASTSPLKFLKMVWYLLVWCQIAFHHWVSKTNYIIFPYKKKFNCINTQTICHYNEQLINQLQTWWWVQKVVTLFTNSIKKNGGVVCCTIPSRQNKCK